MTKTGKSGETKALAKMGSLPEKKVPAELQSIEQWVVRLKLPEPSSAVPGHWTGHFGE